MKPVPTTPTGKRRQTLKVPRRVLLICGVLSSLLYAGADILAIAQWEGHYSYTVQAASELMAIGSPSRSLLIVLFTLYNLLAVAFGLGLRVIESKKRNLRITGNLLVAYGILGQVALLFFPMHLHEAIGSKANIVHIILTAAVVLLLLLATWFGANAHGKRFRLYSIATILVILVFGVLAGMDGSRLALELPTPWLGLKERVNIYAFMLWMMVLAISLLRVEKRPGWLKR